MMDLDGAELALLGVSSSKSRGDALCKTPDGRLVASRAAQKGAFTLGPFRENDAISNRIRAGPWEKAINMFTLKLVDPPQASQWKE